MKEIVKKILEAGLVDKHTALLMEKWRSIDVGAADMVGKEDIRKVSEEALTQFVEELDVLVEQERTSFRETRLSVTMKEPTLVFWVRCPSNKFVVFRDEMGNFVFPVSEWAHIMERKRFQTAEDMWEVTQHTPLIVGMTQYAHLVEASKVDLRR